MASISAMECYVCVFSLWIMIPIIYCQQINNMLEYNLLEEDPGGTIANIPIDSRITQLYEPSELQTITYRFLSQNSPQQDSFEISETTGILRSVEKVDRDAICRHSSSCDIQFDIATEPRDYFHIIKVTIHILDLNDNAPSFEEDAVSLSIPETTVSGTTFALPSAYDADIGEFGIQSFALEPQLVNFALDANINPDGSLSLHLILANNVDRERNQFYNLRVVVWDGGNPVRSGTLNIDITIIDSNDNNPRFLNTTYQVVVNENIPIGRSIFQVRAYDPDEGRNGAVVYELARSTENAYGELFGIDGETGYIFTKAELDHEAGDLYILSVMATDGGINALSSYTKVNVLVNDLNDNAPEITVNALNGLHAEIPENAGMDDFVAHVVIEDIDSGENGEFSCSMTSQYFMLEYLYGNEYQILTTTVFDREIQDEYSVELTCVDNGDTSQVTNRILPVYITDMNDHEPEFDRETYAININEGNGLQEYIGTIIATDMDIGENADITYTITQHYPAIRSGIETLTIDARAGILYANIAFDHEEVSEYTFIITATDGGSEPLSSTAELVLTISDINDEPPIFTNSNYVFGTYENQAVDTEIGTLHATDRDASSEFRDIAFDLDPRFTDVTTFGIDNKSGKLFSKKVLDRELKSDHHVTAVAYNNGYNRMTSTNITVHVADRNDNAPVIEFPNVNNNTVEIKGNHKVDDRVTQVIASDLDIGNNGALSYSIVYGDETDYFGINSFDGVITLKKELKDNAYNKVRELVILVKDDGTPSLSATETLDVFINGTFAMNPPSKQNDTNNNLAIIIICVLVFVIICIVLVLAVLFLLRRQSINRRQQRDHQKYGCQVQAAKTLVDMNTSNNSIRTDFSDPACNKSASFRSGNTISYISPQDAQAGSYQSMYSEGTWLGRCNSCLTEDERATKVGPLFLRVSNHPTMLRPMVDGYCPAGTLVPNRSQLQPNPRVLAELQLQVPVVHIGDMKSEHDVDNSSLTDSGKGSSEGDGINRASPMEHIKSSQTSSLCNDRSGIQQKIPQRCIKPPFQTYLTEHPHTEPCRASPNFKTTSTGGCQLDHQKKTVHFVKPFSVQQHGSSISNEIPSSITDIKNPLGHNSRVRTLENTEQFDTNCYSGNRLPHIQLNCTSNLAPSQNSNFLKNREHVKPSNRQVINLSQYLQERSRDSDCDSQADFSDGETTTSGSYCMDDEDLAHDVLV